MKANKSLKTFVSELNTLSIKAWFFIFFIFLVSCRGGGEGVDTPASTTTGNGITPKVAITTGHYHTCAIDSSGGVKCWGWNASGQLGDGTTTSSSTPVDVVGLASGVKSVAAGFLHTCTLLNSGKVKCWGLPNVYGTTPVEVSDLANGIQSISARNWHICVLTSTGGVQCWGGNSSGQLGDGSNTNNFTPTEVSGLTSGVVAISAGNNHTCALTSLGGVKCWGENSSGQLGNGSVTNSSIPVDVSNLSADVQGIAAGGAHTCALMTAGGVKCWGLNLWGQLGNGTNSGPETCGGNACSKVPIDVTGLTSNVTSISVGGDHTCAILGSGGVKCWGLNLHGQLGNGTTTVSISNPVDVINLSGGVNAISAGEDHTCAVTSSGNIKCWGWNSAGQLGNGTSTGFTTPIGEPTGSSTPVDVIGFKLLS